MFEKITEMKNKAVDGIKNLGLVKGLEIISGVAILIGAAAIKAACDNDIYAHEILNDDVIEIDNTNVEIENSSEVESENNPTE